MGRKKPTPHGLASALFSKVQLNVLGLMLGQPDRSFAISEIIRLAESGSGAVQRELEKLTAAGIVATQVVGKRKFYQANRQSPIFTELHGLVLKTVGLIEPLQKALELYQPKIDVAFVYGSVAKGTDTAKSDIDLMIIGDEIAYGDVFLALHSAEKKLQRPVHPLLMTPEEWRQRRSDSSSFATRIFEQPKMFVLGTADDLSRHG
jgi:predicted nucleotidyltransferase